MIDNNYTLTKADANDPEMRSLSVLSGSHDQEIKLWNIAGYQEERVLQGRTFNRHADAVKWLKRCSPKVGRASNDATVFALLAMAHHRLGQAEAARAALADARATLTKMPDPAKGQPFGNDWHDWLICQILYREAEELLGIKKEP